MKLFNEEMKYEEKIDVALDAILKASGSSLRNYTMQKSLDDMRKVMKAVISESYAIGFNDCVNELNKVYETEKKKTDEL